MSNEAKFTVGPWVFNDSAEWSITMDGECTMNGMTYYPWVPNNKADWHLIAAAPEMYAMLDSMAKGQGFPPGMTIEQTLAKARGETND